MTTLNEQYRIKQVSYENNLLTLFFSENISEEWVHINNDKFLLRENKACIEVNYIELLQLKEVYFFIGNEKIMVNTNNIPQLYGKFPEKSVEHPIKLLISRQNANFIKQPFLRIANGINYGYRVIESSDTKEKVHAEALILELITLTYNLNESTNCKQDKYHLRISLYYVLMQIYISMDKEVDFVNASGELIKVILILKKNHDFKDTFYNIIKALLLIHLYCNKLKDTTTCNVFGLGLELAKKGFNCFDENRVEKTYQEYSEAISDLGLLKKLSNNKYNEKDIFFSGCRAYINKDIVYANFNKFNFKYKIYPLYDIK